MQTMEANEVGEFQKQMSEAGEGGMKHIALAISVLAVLVAMVTVLGHRTHTEAVLMQTRAADQWNLYQAKKIRSGQDADTADILSAQPNAKAADAQQKIATYRSHVDKLKDDLKDEQEKATDLEAEVARAERRANRYDLGEALLQIAVVLSSITLLIRQKAYFLLGLVLGLAGVLTAASAFLVH
jgi:hypothetical protein